MGDPFDRLERFAEKLGAAGWEQIWQVTDDWWMVGFQRKKAFIVVAIIGDRLRVFSPTNQKFTLQRS
jgi:hypothetical protein